MMFNRFNCQVHMNMYIQHNETSFQDKIEKLFVENTLKLLTYIRVLSSI